VISEGESGSTGGGRADGCSETLGIPTGRRLENSGNATTVEEIVGLVN
jgi:hypothetical protein